MKKEVTIKIEEDAYEYFKAQADECNWPVEDFIALAAWSFFKMESKLVTQKENGVTDGPDQ